MCQRLLGDSRLFAWLARIDAEFAEQARGQGCACGGRLHRARYPRKPRGGPADPDGRDALRDSFCCAREGCRKRKTPPSVRFLGRRVYLGAVVLLASACQGGLSRRHVATLRERLGASERTLRRWRAWWQDTFPQTPFWRTARSGFVPPLDAAALPGALIERFSGADPIERVSRVLRFLAPLAAGGF